MNPESFKSEAIKAEILQQKTLEAPAEPPKYTNVKDDEEILESENLIDQTKEVNYEIDDAKPEDAMCLIEQPNDPELIQINTRLSAIDQYPMNDSIPKKSSNASTHDEENKESKEDKDKKAKDKKDKMKKDLKVGQKRSAPHQTVTTIPTSSEARGISGNKDNTNKRMK